MLKTGVLDSVKRHLMESIILTVYRLARFHWKQAQEWQRQTGWQFIYTEDQDMQGKPHEGIDTAVAVSSMVMNFQSIISRNLNPLDPAVLTIGKVEAGTARNVIAGEAKIERDCKNIFQTSSGDDRAQSQRDRESP